MKHLKTYNESSTPWSPGLDPVYRDDRFSVTVFACDRNSSDTTMRTLRFHNVDEFNKQMKDFEDDVKYDRFFFTFNELYYPPSINNLPRGMVKSLTREIRFSIAEWE